METKAIDMIEQILQEYKKERKVVNLTTERKEVSRKYLKMLHVGEYGFTASLDQLIETIAYYYIRNFYDEQAFVDKYTPRLLNASLRNRTKETQPDSSTYVQVVAKLTKRLAISFTIYKLSEVLALLKKINRVYETIVQSESELLVLETVVHRLLGRVRRGFTANPSDIINFNGALDQIKAYKVVKLVDSEYFGGIDNLIMKFLAKYSSVNNFHHITDLENLLKEEGDKVSKSEAIAEFRKTYEEIKLKDAYLLKADNVYALNYIHIYGVTLYNGKTMLVEEKGMDLKSACLFYASVLLHELCHRHRLRKCNFSLSAVTPCDMFNEAGNCLELEAFGRIVDASAESIAVIENFINCSQDKSYSILDIWDMENIRKKRIKGMIELWKKSGMFGDFSDDEDINNNAQNNDEYSKTSQIKMTPMKKNEDQDKYTWTVKL